MCFRIDTINPAIAIIIINSSYVLISIPPFKTQAGCHSRSTDCLGLPSWSCAAVTDSNVKRQVNLNGKTVAAFDTVDQDLRRHLPHLLHRDMDRGEHGS